MKARCALAPLVVNAVTVHALGGVSGMASFITTDKQLQLNLSCCFLVQAMLPGGFPFHQFYIGRNYLALKRRIFSGSQIVKFQTCRLFEK